jgi:hypothetical protein
VAGSNWWLGDLFVGFWITFSSFGFIGKMAVFSVAENQIFKTRRGQKLKKRGKYWMDSQKVNYLK